MTTTTTTAAGAEGIDLDNLLPCPFCGGSPVLQEHEGHAHSALLKALVPGIPDAFASWTIECCDVGMIKGTRTEVVAAWNRRSIPLAEIERIDHPVQHALPAGATPGSGPMEHEQKPSMPEIGSRAHRVLVELARQKLPVPEPVLMAAHGLDGLRPTTWRQGPYKQLVSQGLIAKVGTAWGLSPTGRQLMDEVEADMLGGTSEAPAAPWPRPVPAPIRAPLLAKPLTRQGIGRPMREGAFDYRDIPSLLTGRGIEKD